MFLTRFRRIARLASIMVVATVLANGPTAHAEEDPTLHSDNAIDYSTDSNIQQAIRFRTTSGLRSDRAYVFQAATNGSSFPDVAWGAPLTAVEGAEITRRVELQQSLGPANEYALTQKASAGAYIDQVTGTPVYAFTQDPDAHRAELIGRLPAGTEFGLTLARYTLADLDAAQDRVNGAWRDLQARGVAIRLIGIDDVQNRVVVGVASLTPAVESELSKRFGDTVVGKEFGPIVHDACVSRASCANPDKGGIRISFTSTQWCTAGFMGKIRNSVPLQLRIITAGHCIQLAGGVGATWTHAGVVLGTAEAERWYSGSNADVGSIRDSEGGDRHLFYASSNTDINPVDRFESNVNQLAGEMVCRGGAKSGHMCGHIQYRDVTRDVEGTPINHSYTVDFDSDIGDSGGPIWAGNVAYGIHTDSTNGCCTGVGWYSTIGWILSETTNTNAPLSLCVNATCS